MPEMLTLIAAGVPFPVVAMPVTRKPRKAPAPLRITPLPLIVVLVETIGSGAVSVMVPATATLIVVPGCSSA